MVGALEYMEVVLDTPLDVPLVLDGLVNPDSTVLELGLPVGVVELMLALEASMGLLVGEFTTVLLLLPTGLEAELTFAVVRDVESELLKVGTELNVEFPDIFKLLEV